MDTNGQSVAESELRVQTVRSWQLDRHGEVLRPNQMMAPYREPPRASTDVRLEWTLRSYDEVNF